MTFARHLVAALALVLGAGSPVPLGEASGQRTPAARGWVPVEQTVEDTGPLRRSLRRVAPGLGRVGQESVVYRRPGEADKLYYVAPGVTAEFDRSRYIRTRRRGVLQKIPPNTVFHIAPPPAASPGEPRGAPPSPPPPRMEARVDGRVRPNGEPPPSGAPAEATGREEWAAYDRLLTRQRRSVIDAIGGAIAGEPGAASFHEDHNGAKGPKEGEG